MGGVPAAITFDFERVHAGPGGRAHDVRQQHPPAYWHTAIVELFHHCRHQRRGQLESRPRLRWRRTPITGYIWDFGANNYEVGHRRWILYPQTQIMAAGDVPAESSFEAANATWVFDANFGGPRPATTKPYVAWPPEGFVPYSLAFPQWSFALSNADFSAATVTMTSNGVQRGRDQSAVSDRLWRKHHRLGADGIGRDEPRGQLFRSAARTRSIASPSPTSPCPVAATSASLTT